MNGKKYLVYLDILGFEILAEEIEEERGIESREVREKFIDVINERVKTIERGGGIIGKRYGESDDWLLLTDSLENVFESILKILDHHTPYKGFEEIPLEIAIGTGEYDKWARFDGKELIIEKSTIKFLKTKIIGYYHDWYKQKYNNEPPKSTFIVLTESAYHELEPLDRKICQKVGCTYEEDDREKIIIFFSADVDKVKQRGRVFKFLEKIGYAGNKWYGRIDEVYVPPLEYDDVARTLKEKRIVFITGTQEYGKTYTAVRLMWEYYNSGYEPRWIKGGEPTERVGVRKKLENIRAELKPRHIIYFEDPFGKTKYERREGLEREIGTIIDTVKQVEDVYVIITSREEVFKEFEKEKLSAKELKEFEEKLSIKKPSYDDEKRKEILLKWAEAENCKWLRNKELKELVLDYMWSETILPTPLSIKDFAVATFDIEGEDELKEKIEEKSKETAKAFAEEIKNMTDDKILFLSFPFISKYFKVEFVRVTYQELVKELNLKYAWEFGRIFNWFYEDKINISEKYIVFSHSSYSEALPYLLVEDGYITRINREIFSKLLLKLSEKDAAAWHVASAVAANFGKLPENVRNKLLLKLSEKDEAAEDVASAVAANFGKLPENVRNLLFKLSEKDEAAGDVAWAVAANFGELPENVRNKLLLKLSEKDEAAGDVAWAVADNFGELPENVRNKLLLKLSEKDAAAWHVASAVADNFDELPENVRNLLFKLSEKDEAAGDVAWAVADNFGELPENVRNLLFKLSEKDAAAGDVARAVADNFGELPENVRNLLFKLSEKDAAAGDVAWAVAANFGKLPENVRNLLFKLSEKDEAAWHVASAVAANFGKLPENVRNLLFKLSEKDEAAWHVASAVAANFDELPENVRNLLFKLSEKDKAAGDVAMAVAANFDELPENVRNLLFKLSEKDEAAEDVTWAVADNFDKLPENVRDLLDKLQKPLQQVIEDLSSSVHKWDKEEALWLISNALPKINPDFVSKILNELSKCEYETVRTKAAKMRKDIFDGSKGKKEC